MMAHANFIKQLVINIVHILVEVYGLQMKIKYVHKFLIPYYVKK
jgi:hypothetical protein